MRLVVNATSHPPYLQERDLLTIIQEAGWAPGLVWMNVENPTPTRIPSLDHPVCNELGTYCKKTWGRQCNKITFEHIFFHISIKCSFISTQDILHVSLQLCVPHNSMSVPRVDHSGTF